MNAISELFADPTAQHDIIMIDKLEVLDPEKVEEIRNAPGYEQAFQLIQQLAENLDEDYELGEKDIASLKNWLELVCRIPERAAVPMTRQGGRVAF
jgi:hypothetical protein